MYGVDNEAPLPVQTEEDVTVPPCQVVLSNTNMDVISRTLRTEFPDLNENLWNSQPYVRCCELVEDILSKLLVYMYIY